MDGEQMGQTYALVGGRPCLDFVNTLEEWGGRYADLVAWSARIGVLTAQEAEPFTVLAANDPTALHALRQAVTLRHALYEMFSAVAAGSAPAPRALATLNDSLVRAMARLRLVTEAPGQLGWAWAADSKALDRPLWPIVRDASDLLTGNERSRVRECERPGCDRLFVDYSRNHSRRWCEMAHCGMLVKSRRHYARTRGTRGSSPVAALATESVQATGPDPVEAW